MKLLIQPWALLAISILAGLNLAAVIIGPHTTADRCLQVMGLSGFWILCLCLIGIRFYDPPSFCVECRSKDDEIDALCNQRDELRTEVEGLREWLDEETDPSTGRTVIKRGVT